MYMLIYVCRTYVYRHGTDTYDVAPFKIFIVHYKMNCFHSHNFVSDYIV